MQPLVDQQYLLQKFPGKGGWTYAVIPEIIPDKHTPFGWVTVKGRIDDYELEHARLMPMGNGRLFLPVRAEIRKKIRKQEGDPVHIVLYAAVQETGIPEEWLAHLAENPAEYERFLQFSDREQKILVGWIYAAGNERLKKARMQQAVIQIAQREK